MSMDFTNKALQPISAFALQINKNSFGLIPAAALQVAPVLNPNQTIPTNLVLNTNGPTLKTQPLTNLQVKNVTFSIVKLINVFSYSCN
jgi:AP-1 complex subunit beta-1